MMLNLGVLSSAQVVLLYSPAESPNFSPNCRAVGAKESGWEKDAGYEGAQIGLAWLSAGQIGAGRLHWLVWIASFAAVLPIAWQDYFPFAAARRATK